MSEKDYTDYVIEIIEQGAAAKGITPEQLISDVLTKLHHKEGHPVHISKSTHRVTLRLEAIRKLIWKEDVRISAMADMTGVSVNTLRRIATHGGKIWARTAWKISTGFGVPIESICNIKSLRGVVTGWEDTEKTMK